ncbi:MAG: KEOPS complex subunit Cgi121 [Promethearchaeota archaeon]
MITKSTIINEFDLKYSVGISKIKLGLNSLSLEDLFKLIEEIQNDKKGSMIQFFNDEFILNSEHVFNACYFTIKAFNNGINISNQKNLEFILYLATKRQIKQSLNDFGLNSKHFSEKELTFCIISSLKELSLINEIILQKLNAKHLTLDMNKCNYDKFKRIKNYFKISDNQISVVLKTYGLKLPTKTPSEEDKFNLYKVLNDLICEKMTLLSLEKIKVN